MASLNVTKELLPITSQSLVLCQIQLVDGSLVNVSTHPINSSEGGAQYLGVNYFARLSDQNLGAVQARSDQGIDRIPSVTLTIENADENLWAAVEGSGVGWKGAIVTLIRVFWTADTSTFSSDNAVPFVGIIDSAVTEKSVRGEVIKLTANSSGNLARAYLPTFPIQQFCAANFPPDAASRLDGATNQSSPYWMCGYSADITATDPDIGGSAQRGNFQSGSTPFTTCNYTQTNCVARGMYKKDSSNRATGRFTGATFAPLNRETRSKSYLQGKTITVLSSRNDAAYKQQAPMVYGTQWVDAVGLQSLGDGNSTRGEYLITAGNIGNNGVLQVEINGVLVPRNGSSPDNQLYRWNFCGDPALGTTLATGGRNGVACADAEYNSQGDPHGSQAVVEIVVYNQVWASGTQAPVRILTTGPTFPCPNGTSSSGQASWPKLNSTNSAFVLLDLMIRSNRVYAEFDLQTFIDGATYCDQSVSYTTLTGGTATHAMYKAQFAIETQRTAAEYIKSVLRSFNAQLVKDPVSGLFKLLIRKTLADQQSAPVAGSNNASPISSVTAFGVTANGYSAYDFDETNITRETADDPPFLPIDTGSSAGTPNSISAPFQDEDNTYAQDTLSVVDVDAVQRAGGYQGGQVIGENSSILGFSNFDQGFRVLRCIQAETFRGNPLGDTRGTYVFKLKCNFRASHLNVGAICRLSWAKKGLVNQPIRIRAILWAANYESCEITATWHTDAWYTVAFGQQGPPTGLILPATKARLPYPPEPYAVQAVATDSVFGAPTGFAAGSWWSFAVAQLSAGTAIAQAQLFACPPTNVISTSGTGGTTPPLIGVQGAAASTGGTIPGGLTLYMAVAAIDASGNLTQLSQFCTAVTPTGTNTCTITTPQLSWFGGASGYVVYAGTDELYSLTEQARSTGTPSTITLSALNYSTYGAPDPVAVGLNARAKRLTRAGLFTAVVTAVSTNKITVAPPSTFTTNQFAGYDLALLSNAFNDANQVPWANYRVASNDGTSFTLTVDPTGIVEVGGVVMLWPKPDTHTATTIGDSQFVNVYSTGLVTTGIGHNGDVVRIMAGTGRGQSRPVLSNTGTVSTVSIPFNPVPDATSRFVIESATWEYDLDGTPNQNANPNPSTAPLVAQINIQAFEDSVLLFQLNSFDANDNYSPDIFAPLRLMYVFGNPADLVAAPGPVTGLTIDSITYDTQYATIQGHAALPSTLNDFAGCLMYAVIGTDKPLLVNNGPYKAGDPTFTFTITYPLPAVAQAWLLYAVSYNPQIQAQLVQSGGGASPSVALSIGPGIPGNITAISTIAIDQATDTQFVFLSGTAFPPSPLLGFNGCEIYYENTSIGSTDGPHDIGFYAYDNSGTYSFKVKIPAPPTAQTWQIWFVSANPTITATLIPSGGSASATVTGLAIAARGTSSVPAAPNVGTVTGVVVFSTDGNSWGYNPITIQAPTGGWVTGMQIQVDSVGDLAASPIPVNTLFIAAIVIGAAGSPATATSPFVGVGGPTSPNFERPPFGITQTFKLRVTAQNSVGAPTPTPVESSIITVTGGGSASAPLNVVSISNAVTYNNNQFSVTSTFHLPTNYTLINSMDMRIAAYSGGVLAADNDIGVVNWFDFTSTTFVFTHGPYDRPATGVTQMFAVGARVYSGTGVLVSSPTYSAQFPVIGPPATASAADLVQGLTAIRSATVPTVDGLEQAIIELVWTMPTSTDMSQVLLVAKDTTNGTPSQTLNTFDLGDNSYGSAGSYTYTIPAVTAVFEYDAYSVNAAGVIVGFNSTTLSITAATTGALKVNRADPATLAARLTVSAAKLDLQTASVTDNFIASMAITKLIAGNLTVQMNVAVGGSLVVAGSGFNITMNTSIGIVINNTTNSQQVTLQPGYLLVQGNSTLAGQNATLNCGALVLNTASGGGRINLQAGGAGIVQAQFIGGASQWSLTASDLTSQYSLICTAANALIQMQGLTSTLLMGNNGATIVLNGNLRIGTSTSSPIVIDVNGRLNAVDQGAFMGHTHSFHVVLGAFLGTVGVD